MEIRKVPVLALKPASYNPRADLKPGDLLYEKIRKSIQEFGLVDPLIWNCRTGNLVGGHQRLKILLELGCHEVEVSVVDLPLEREKLLNVSLNKNLGEWNSEKLTALFSELCLLSDSDVAIAGFDPIEIDEILAPTMPQGTDDDFDVGVAAAAVQEPITKRGDLIELGPHQLLCGDSSNPDDLAKLMGGEVAQMLFTDPPYRVAYLGGNRPNPDARPKPSRRWEMIYNDNLSQPDYEQWLKKVFETMTPHLIPGAPIYVWNGHRQFGPMHQMLITLGYHIGCVITWAKESISISYADYSMQTEFAMYGWKSGAAHRWYGSTKETSLWNIKRDPTKNYVHPTQKPVHLPIRALTNSSKRGDVVLELFSGSGSTLIAADFLGRRCFGMEIEPGWCDVIVKRYLAFAGKNCTSEELRARYAEAKMT